MSAQVLSYILSFGIGRIGIYIIMITLIAQSRNTYVLCIMRMMEYVHMGICGICAYVLTLVISVLDG